MVASILDDVAGMAAVALVGEGFRGTIGMSVSFLEKTRPGTYLSQARIVGCNKSVLFAEASIVAEDGAVLATSTGQYAYTLLGA